MGVAVVGVDSIDAKVGMAVVERAELATMEPADPAPLSSKGQQPEEPSESVQHCCVDRQ